MIPRPFKSTTVAAGMRIGNSRSYLDRLGFLSEMSLGPGPQASDTYWQQC
jgi:hypothetical protein